MKKVAYLLDERAVMAKQLLSEQGYEVIGGNGTFTDEALARCWALLPGRGRVTKEILDKAPNLRIISKQGVGVERIDVEECTRRGICVANTPLSNYISVAEHTFALILAAAKRFYPLGIRLRKDPPEYPRGIQFPAVELYGKTLSLIGFGNIGARVAKLANGFDMKVVAYTRHPERVSAPDYVTLLPSMEEAIRAGDIVSLHVSGTAENKGLFGKEQFAQMKPTAIFINTTRGVIVDEAALYEALANQTIAGAGIDVFADEPVLPGNPLLPLENLIATPHTAANTMESRNRAAVECVQSVLDFAAGRWPLSAVNRPN